MQRAAAIGRGGSDTDIIGIEVTVVRNIIPPRVTADEIEGAGSGIKRSNRNIAVARHNAGIAIESPVAVEIHAV